MTIDWEARERALRSGGLNDFIEEIKRLTVKTEIDQITMDNFLGQLNQKDAEISRLFSEGALKDAVVKAAQDLLDGDFYDEDEERLRLAEALAAVSGRRE